MWCLCLLFVLVLISRTSKNRQRFITLSLRSLCRGNVCGFGFAKGPLHFYMGNTGNKPSLVHHNSVNGVYIQRQDWYQNWETSIHSGRSFGSVSSNQSSLSVARPWSRISRRRWKESTLTLPYESSKTAWPVSQLESFFLPEFPLENASKYRHLGEISQGSFGKVYKVQSEADEEKSYALKVLSKAKIIKENAVRQVKDEVQIQRACGHHPFIVACPRHWQTRKRLYIVSDFVEGGELYSLLDAYSILPVALVKIYVAQLALAIDFLHNAGVIYRDLKPENILLDSEGHLQLIDFGLSKWLSYGKSTETVCGTLLYMAPEVLTCRGYSHAVDWWSLGIICCLMLTSKYPSIETDSGQEDNGNTVVELPSADLEVASKDLLLRLLTVEPMKRLRNLRSLKNIGFFKDFDFGAVSERRVKPNLVLKEFFPEGPPEKEDPFGDFDTPL